FLHKDSIGIIEEGKIINKSCDITFYKFIPCDLKKTPYVILVSKGIHKHLLPPPERVPKEIMNKLKTMIETATIFGTNYLSEVHASLNNLDKLRHLVSKVQKEHNPYGQGILGSTYSIWKEKKEYEDYVQQA
ncbi:11359_t:CDS:2, partial [Gigaspora rosea]